MHLKYKAKTWDDLVGNEHIKKALKSYTYDYPLMFEGEKGCGKSSIANILINNFDVDPNNVKIINCGVYNDIKSNREEVKSLNETTIFGRNKVLVLDETHMLTSGSENAWLVPLENLREGVLIFACTTETGKLSDTFLRRFVRYKVKPLTDEQSLELINKICIKDDITLPKWLKSLIIEKSQGIPGHILTAIPKVIDIDNQDEAKYLLDLSLYADIEEDVYDLFNKLFLTKSIKWGIIEACLKKLLTKYSAEKIKADLMNIIGFKLNRVSFDDGKLLCKMFDTINSSNYYLERAGMNVLIFKLFSLLRV